MAELTYIKINGLEIKQLWYGVFNAVNEKDFNMVYKSYSCKNALTYTEQPERDLSGNLWNEDIETFYVPSVTFKLGYVNEDIYKQLLYLLNKKRFSVEYYDYEIGKKVIRDMYMTENSLNDLHIIGAELKGFIDISLTFVSRKSYSSYYELSMKNEATNLDAFDDLIVVDSYFKLKINDATTTNLHEYYTIKNQTGITAYVAVKSPYIGTKVEELKPYKISYLHYIKMLDSTSSIPQDQYYCNLKFQFLYSGTTDNRTISLNEMD